MREVANRLWDRKNLPVLGYALLAMAVAFALYSDTQHNQDAREQIARESVARDKAIRFEARRANKETEAARKERIAQLNDINKRQCEEIEALKAARREEARDNYVHLERNAALASIPVTTALRARAKEAYMDTLRRFKKGTCPRVILK